MLAVQLLTTLTATAAERLARGPVSVSSLDNALKTSIKCDGALCLLSAAGSAFAASREDASIASNAPLVKSVECSPSADINR